MAVNHRSVLLTTRKRFVRSLVVWRTLKATRKCYACYTQALPGRNFAVTVISGLDGTRLFAQKDRTE